MLSTAPIISTGIIQGVQQWAFPLSISQIHSSSPHFRTINQIIRKGPLKPKPKKKSVLDGNPQMKGIVLQVMIRKPKKPNSAQRKCCRVRLSNGKELTAYIPGVGHTLQEHNVVLVEAGRTQDLPGIKIKVIRGKYDCAHPVKRWLYIVSNTAIICFNILYLGVMCTRQANDCNKLVYVCVYTSRNLQLHNNSYCIDRSVYSPDYHMVKLFLFLTSQLCVTSHIGLWYLAIHILVSCNTIVYRSKRPSSIRGLPWKFKKPWKLQLDG